MDKFGIFKLLNSFFNYYGQKTQDSTNQKQDSNEQNSNLFSGLVNALNKNNLAEPSSMDKNATKNSTPPHPLQMDMLNTMNSHDAFIKRVKQKNPQ